MCFNFVCNPYNTTKIKKIKKAKIDKKSRGELEGPQI